MTLESIFHAGVILEKMYEKDKKFDGFLSKVFVNLMQKDEGAKTAIHDFIKVDDRGALTKMAKVGGGWIAWIISLFIAGFVGHLWK